MPRQPDRKIKVPIPAVNVLEDERAAELFFAQDALSRLAEGALSINEVKYEFYFHECG